MDADFLSDTCRQARDALGREIAAVYDHSFGQVGVQVDHARHPRAGMARTDLHDLTSDQLDGVLVAAPYVIQTVLFQLLSHLEWLEDMSGPVRISVRVGDQVVENPAGCSDLLAVELLGDGGWLERFATCP